MKSLGSSENNRASKRTSKEEGKEEDVSSKTLPTLSETLYSVLTKGSLFAQENFRAKPDDIFVCSAPKTGTTWLKALSFSIVTRTHFGIAENPLLSKISHACMPFLEKDFIKNPKLPESVDLPLWATHLPYSSLPNSIIDSGCKIVYICRDPKDVFVSAWHFLKKLESDSNRHVSLEEAFESYCEGISFYGSYWDHYLGYWKASLESPGGVLFLKYEELMEDTAFYLKRMAEFMGYPFSVEEENVGVVQKIVDLCSFQNLSNLEVNKTGKHGDQGGGINNTAFFRKGKIGDWKNYLTAEMGERLDKITEEKFEGSGLKF